MNRTVLGAALVCALGCGGGAAHVARTRRTPKEIYSDTTPAIVKVHAGPNKLGTGFVVERSGLVATNLHVIAGEAEIQIQLLDGSMLPVIAIANLDPPHDLALLKVEPKRPLPALRIGDSNGLAPGDQVYAIGNPMGLDDTISDGLVSKVLPLCTDQQVEARRQLIEKIGRQPDEVRRELLLKGHLTHDEEELVHVLGCVTELTLLQISTPISQGSSGGPLFNQFGEVVGVTTAIYKEAQNINIAMPAKYLGPLIAGRGTPLALSRFAQLTREPEEDERPHSDSDTDTSVPPRQIPDLPVSTWDGCKPTDIADTVASIMSAIDIGAPAYNKMTPQGFEECFRVYEGTGLRLEQGGPCKGVRSAFGDGLLRASTLKSYKDKAWAMRDTFDGMIKVSMEWCVTNQANCPEPIRKLFRSP